MNTRTLLMVLVCLTSTTEEARAQGTIIIGRVLRDSTVPLVGAEVVLSGPQNLQRTDDKGEFRFVRVPVGSQIIGVRAPGFAPMFDTIAVVASGEIHARVYKLSRIEATLPEVPVTTTLLDRKLFEFHERRRMGIGRFLDSAEFANTRGTRTGDRLSKLPGLLIQRGGYDSAIVTNTRQRLPGAAGANKFCRSLVWLDGVNLGTGYDVNELNPSIIAAVEWYAGQASIPAKYAVQANPAERYCGVLVIWLR